MTSDDELTIELSMAELRAVAGYAVACVEPALVIVERDRPDDRRPRAAVDLARVRAPRPGLAGAVRC